MGLQDRHYYREQPRFNPLTGDGRYPSGWSGISGWSVNTWIIVINVAVFVIDALLFASGVTITHTLPVEIDPNSGRVLLDDVPDAPLRAVGFFSTSYALFGFQVWRFITFQFLHASFAHIFFNMLALYWFGPQVEQYLGSRRYLAFYLLSGCAGAALYLILNLAGNLIGPLPFLLPGSPYTPLIGASAGVFAVLLAIAYIRPNDIVMLLIPPIPMRIKTLAFVLLGIAIYTLLTGGPNAGGEAGHLGGALLGAYLIRRPFALNWALRIPLDSWKARGRHAFRGFDAGYSRPPVSPWAPRERKPTMFRRYWEQRQHRTREGHDEEVDRILAKIATHGIQSLTAREREVLAEDTRRKRGG